MLEDVELASIERVDSQIKNFDLILIYKDYTKPVRHIDNIPKVNLQQIKEWLNSENILFIEGGNINIKWDKYLKTVVEDPEAFIQDGGWTGFMESDSSEEENSEDGENQDSQFDEESDEESEEDYTESDLVDEEDEGTGSEEEEFEDDYYDEEESDKKKKNKK